MTPAVPGQPDTRLALREPAHQVSRKAPWLWAVGSAIWATIVFAAMLVVHLLWFELPVWAWPSVGVVALLYIAVMPVVRFRIHRWESTETAVYTQTGWLSRERRIAPMSRVQTVDFQQTAVGRLFGLASVTVTTASAAGPIRIDAIDRPQADRLVDDLTRRAEAEQGDAT